MVELGVFEVDDLELRENSEYISAHFLSQSLYINEEKDRKYYRHLLVLIDVHRKNLISPPRQLSCSYSWAGTALH